MRDAARLPCRRRLVHRGRRGPPADARRERNGRVDAGLLLEAHGRLAPEHGRLEHLAQALLRVAASVLSVRMRAPHGHRLPSRARGAGGAGTRSASGAPPPLDRRGRHSVRGVRTGGAARPGGRRRVARRRDRPAVDARLGERRQHRRRQWNRGCEGTHARRPPRPRLLGGVVPGGLGLRDARADPALVLLHLVHVGHARRTVAVPARAHLREAPRRDRPRDAPLVGKRDRGRRGARADGRRRHALAVLLAAAEPESAVRLRACSRDPAEAPHALELVQVPRRLREHRELDTRLGRPRLGAGRPARAARPLARRADARARRRRDQPPTRAG